MYFPHYNCDQELEHLLLSNGGWYLLQFLCLFLQVTNWHWNNKLRRNVIGCSYVSFLIMSQEELIQIKIMFHLLHIISMFKQQVLRISKMETLGPNSVTLYSISWDSLPNYLVLTLVVISTTHCSRNCMVNLFKKGDTCFVGVWWSVEPTKRYFMPLYIPFSLFPFFEFHYKTALKTQNCFLYMATLVFPTEIK